MTWTSDKPKTPGWYWWRDVQPGVIQLRIYQVYDFDDGQELVAGDDELTPVSRLGGHWAGPLEPPR